MEVPVASLGNNNFRHFGVEHLNFRYDPDGLPEFFGRRGASRSRLGCWTVVLGAVAVGAIIVWTQQGSLHPFTLAVSPPTPAVVTGQGLREDLLITNGGADTSQVVVALLDQSLSSLPTASIGSKPAIACPRDPTMNDPIRFDCPGLKAGHTMIVHLQFSPLEGSGPVHIRLAVDEHYGWRSFETAFDVKLE